MMTKMVEVTQEDANNYSRILALLGMEEEGEPVAEIETLLALREKVYRLLDEHTLCGCVETRIRFLLAEHERATKATAVLRELLALKAIKDGLPEDPGRWSNDEAASNLDYWRRNGLVWAAARNALDA